LNVGEARIGEIAEKTARAITAIARNMARA
jgi:hypothetical protein